MRETVSSIARLHKEHRSGRTRVQRVTEGVTARVATPAFLAAILTLALNWMALNVALPVMGRDALDPAPFFWLQEPAPEADGRD